MRTTNPEPLPGSVGKFNHADQCWPFRPSAGRHGVPNPRPDLRFILVPALATRAITPAVPNPSTRDPILP